MKKSLMTICVAAVALAIPAGAFAHDGHGKGGGDHHFRGHGHSAQLVKLTGTGTSFAGASATASGTIAGSDPFTTGTFSATLATNWAASTTKTSDKGSLACAPATATVNVVGAVTTNTVSTSLTGKTCAFTKTDGTVVRAFFGSGTVTAAGTLAALNGSTGKAFLFQKADGTVSGGVFAGSKDSTQSKDSNGKDSNGKDLSTFSVREHSAAHATGNCDHGNM
jgi:hypothetical protein